NLMQRHKGRFRYVYRFEALAGAESRDGQQPALVSGVPEIPLSTPGGFEERHLHHVDHTLSPRMCPAVYHVFSFRFHKSKQSDLVKNLNHTNSAILAVYPDISRSTYDPTRSGGEQMPSKAMRHCASSMPGVLSSPSRTTTSSSTN